MPTENPFRPPRPDLDPDQVPFFEEFAGASDEELKNAGIISPPLSSGENASVQTEADHKITASDTEKEAYKNELAECAGALITRDELVLVQKTIERINQNLKDGGKSEISLSKEIKLYRIMIGGIDKEQLFNEIAKNTRIYSARKKIIESNEFDTSPIQKPIVLIQIKAKDLGMPIFSTLKLSNKKLMKPVWDYAPLKLLFISENNTKTSLKT